MDWTQIVLAVIAGVPATIVAYAAYRQTTRTHDAVNSRMTELLEKVKQLATAEATAIEKDAQKLREAEATIARAAVTTEPLAVEIVKPLPTAKSETDDAT